MKYLKAFNTHTNYTEYTSSSVFTNLDSDSVNYCIQENEVHFNKPIETKLVIKYNVTDTSNPTKLSVNFGYGEQTSFESIEIDGVLINAPIPLSYTFDTIGEHTVKYTTNSTSIGRETFYDCDNITSIFIPDSFESINYAAFGSCNNLTSVTIGNNVTIINSQAFMNCNNLTSVTIGNNVTTINSQAFSGCVNLTSITIPNSVTNIESSAFSGIFIQSNNFINNSSLDAVTNNYWGAKVYDVIENGLYINTSTNSIIKYIGDATTITIPNTVTHITDSAFYDCDSLTSITIPDNITNIESNAFSNCSNIRSLTIGNGVTTIAATAFNSCIITSFTNNSSLDAAANNYWGATICDTITNDGLVIKNNSVIRYIGNSSTVTIPDSITSIGDSAFTTTYADNITSLIIGTGVTSIGAYALLSMKNIESITSLRTTAPSVQKTTFAYIKTGGTLYVPQGSTGYDAWMSTSNYYLGKSGWTKVEQ